MDCRLEISEAPTLCHTSEVCSRTQTQQTWRTGHGHAHLRWSTRYSRVNRSMALILSAKKGTSRSCLMSVSAVYRIRSPSPPGLDLQWCCSVPVALVVEWLHLTGKVSLSHACRQHDSLSR